MINIIVDYWSFFYKGCVSELKVLIIGGTRFIGPYVISQLVSQGHEVAIYNRNQTKMNAMYPVIQIQGDRNSIEDSIEDFKRFAPEVVLDMIPFNEDEARRTLAVFEGIAKRIVAISSADVYRSFGRLIGTEPGETLDTPSSENSPLREKMFPYRDRAQPGDFKYNYEKILVEKVYLSSNLIAGTILRLPMVYGPGDRQNRLYPYLKRMIDGRPYILLDEIQANWKTTRGYVENVAHAIVLAILNDTSRNKIYNVSENNYHEQEWIQLIGKYANWKGIIEIFKTGKINLSWNFHQDIDMSSQKIRQELGYSEIVSFEDGLKRTMEWENNFPPENISEIELDYKKEEILMKEKNI
jgi:nucleoside-diphosphate-sugar epimerase